MRVRFEITSKKAEVQVYAVCRSGSTQFRGKTGLFIEPDFYDFVTGKGKVPVKKTDVQIDRHVEIKRKLEALELHINRSGITRNDPLSSLQDIINMYNDPMKLYCNEDTMLIRYIDAFIKKLPTRPNGKGGFVTPSTINCYTQMERHIIEFHNYKNRPDTDIDDINKAFFDDFAAYLTINCKHTPATINRYIKFLKSILNEAFQNEVRTKPIPKIALMPLKTTRRIYLTDDEIEKLKRVDLSKKPLLNETRNAFIVQCYTAVRRSDIMQVVNPNNRKGNIIEIKQTKTTAKLVIPIHPHIEDLLNNGQFPSKINGDYNKRLKKVAKLAGLDREFRYDEIKGGVSTTKTAKVYELISSHTGRRSFITNSLKKGHNENLIIAVSGHTSTQMLRIYDHTEPELKANNIRNMWIQDLNQQQGNF
jgi:site-specific recombinase XerD